MEVGEPQAEREVSAGDRPAPPPDDEPTAEVRIVTPRLFETLGIPLREGRDFSAADAAGRPAVVIVSESVAREFWPGRSAQPVLQRFR